jgi:type IV secretion system protein VirD4
MVRLAVFVVRPLARLLAILIGTTVLIVATARVYIWLAGSPPSDRATVAFNLAVASALVAAGVARVVWRRRTREAHLLAGQQRSTAHGSARWGTTRTLDRPAGLLVGRTLTWPHTLLRYDGEAHVLTLAPTGAGKGIGCVIPNLLVYPGSVLVTDPKGENYEVTAARRRQMGQRVLALDPFGLVGGAACFNPLDALDPASPGVVDDAAALAELLVVREPRESAESLFWAEEAKALLAGLMLHIVSSEPPQRRVLATAWEYLSLPGRSLTRLWTSMEKSLALHGAVARAGARLRQKADRVRSGILAQAQSQTHFLESPQLAAAMQRSTFTFSELKTGRLSLYLIVPPDRIESCRRWLRLIVGCALQAVMRTHSPRARPGERVLFLLDEFPALGRMPPLERAVALARGYGALCWLLAQDLTQLEMLYPGSWSTFVANAGVVQAFGTNDVETATYLSTMLGTTTAHAVHATHSVASGAMPWSTGDARESWTASQHARALLTPDEIRRLDPTTALILRPGHDPVRVRRLDYREE